MVRQLLSMIACGASFLWVFGCVGTVSKVPPVKTPLVLGDNFAKRDTAHGQYLEKIYVDGPAGWVSNRPVVAAPTSWNKKDKTIVFLYDISDLVAGEVLEGDTGEWVKHVIYETVAPNSWDLFATQHFDKSSRLHVRTTLELHVQVEAVIEKLRRIRRVQDASRK